MKLDFKNIHIGNLIRQRAQEYEIPMSRICNFFDASEDEILAMYKKDSLEAALLMKWCKVLEYDFFRIYSQHLILYSPPTKHGKAKEKPALSLPTFRKNIYTKEIIDFILERISSGEKTRLQVIEEYKIPKTTLYKWISKYGKSERTAV